MSDPFPLSGEDARRSFPIQDYAVIGDGRTAALVAPDGTIAWWCVPDIDSAPLFDSLLDAEEGGAFALQPAEPFRAERRYREGSNVLETVFTCASGSVRITESMNSTLAGRLPWCELARRVEGLEGSVRMRARLLFGTRADSASPWLQPNRNAPVFHVGPVLGLVRASPHFVVVREEDREILLEGTVAAGERALIAVVAGEDQPLGVLPLADVDRRIDATDAAWRAWTADLCYDGPYRAQVERSALALKLLLFSPTGAIAAAATTSLPERVGGRKNWDYRYAWVRDAAYTLAAFLRLGVVPEAQAAFCWLVRRLGETGAKVCYRLDGSAVPEVEEQELPGYHGSRPVVTGNQAAAQHQHGIYGDILEAAAAFVCAGNILDAASAAVLARLADECADRWRRKDAGMWELEEPRHYTMSKISCWQALDRAIALAEHGHLPSTCVDRWRRERERIVEWVDVHCWSEAVQAYSFYAGSDHLDASLALAPYFGFPNRERLSATLDAIRRGLGAGPRAGNGGPWLYRYSGAEREEGAFLACTFWLAEGYASLDRRKEGAALMEAALAALPPGVGILGEMIDPDMGSMLGNLPQGLSHLALIHAAISSGRSGAAHWYARSG